MTTQQSTNDYSISLENNITLFNHASTNGLNMEGVLTYTYLFSGPTMRSVKNFANALKKEKFVRGRRYPICKGKKIAIELKRKEAHTPHTLYELEIKLAEFSLRHAVEYGGFEADVYMNTAK
ncbi:hypothetical protein D770_05345 [Flammeovirgaceae bacterium 311]|nr:hypothetical protein D770_05345 [Flammeovirgaceae bacterium 311]